MGLIVVEVLRMVLVGGLSGALLVDWMTVVGVVAVVIVPVLAV